jgi:hypothetical protein
MEIIFCTVQPNKNSIEKELIFYFKIKEISTDKIPLRIAGFIATQDGKKIADINDGNINNDFNLYLNAKTSDSQFNSEIGVGFSVPFTKKVIDYIECYRHKNKSKEVIFNIHFQITLVCSNVVISTLGITKSFNDGDTDNELSVKYKNDTNYFPQRTNLWILSGNDSSTFLNMSRYQMSEVTVKIGLMEWVNEFIPYFQIGNILVVELLQPSEINGSKKITDRFIKAQESLIEIKKQLDFGEWNQAIIASRSILELFKNFDEFKKILIDNGYSEQAYLDLKKSIDAFFDFISKFHHSLAKGNVDINPTIYPQKEDAYFVYSFGVSLLHLISQKTKKESIS